jgi:hypothetical protein
LAAARPTAPPVARTGAILPMSDRERLFIFFRSIDVVRSWLFAVLACVALAAQAEEAAPASGGNGATSFKSSVKRMGSDIGDAGKKMGQEFAKAGKQVGQGTVKTVKSIGHKISSDVKTKNFKPKANGEDRPEPSGRGDEQR